MEHRLWKGTSKRSRCKVHGQAAASQEGLRVWSFERGILTTCSFSFHVHFFCRPQTRLFSPSHLRKRSAKRLHPRPTPHRAHRAEQPRPARWTRPWPSLQRCVRCPRRSRPAKGGMGLQCVQVKRDSIEEKPLPECFYMVLQWFTGFNPSYN